MAYEGRISGQQRTAAAGGAVLAALAVGALLAGSFTMPVRRLIDDSLAVFDIATPPPPEPPAVKPDDRESGEASEANRAAKAAPISAPKPKITLIVPPVAAAPVAGTGREASSGAAPDPGPGAGAGGFGQGGGGGAGSGSGRGTRPVWQRGTIRNSDYPDAASRARIGGNVEVRFTILTTGRVTRCRVVVSSGHALLDERTCFLIERRFRFKPATDANGDPVASDYGWRQSWWLEPRH